MNKIFSLLVLLLTIGCSTVEDEINPETQDAVDVYVVGVKNNAAAYWKNNQEFLLNNGIGASADTLLVSNNNVHVFGKKPFDNWTTAYLYWKNNVLTNLTENFSTPDQVVRTITGIDVVGDDVYFVGFTKNPLITAEIYDLVYWKNGVKTVLGLSSNHSYRARIKVVNNTVYVLGTISNCFNFCEGVYINGVFNPLENLQVGLRDFAVKNDEVYVYGYNYGEQTGFYKNLATNIETTLPQFIMKMIFDENDIYLSTDDIITKNGNVTPSDAQPSNGITNYTSFIKDFKVLNGNVFYIKRCNPLLGLPSSIVGINNTNIFQINDSNTSFNGITIVQN
jgi:hypothetical protein